MYPYGCLLSSGKLILFFHEQQHTYDSVTSTYIEDKLITMVHFKLSNENVKVN